MKKIFPLLLFSITYFSLLKVNAQCSNTLPAKPWGDDRPATECELLFYRTNYPLIIKSFQKMETYIANNYIPGGYNPDPNKGMIDFDANSVVDNLFVVPPPVTAAIALLLLFYALHAFFFPTFSS